MFSRNHNSIVVALALALSSQAHANEPVGMPPAVQAETPNPAPAPVAGRMQDEEITLGRYLEAADTASRLEALVRIEQAKLDVVRARSERAKVLRGGDADLLADAGMPDSALLDALPGPTDSSIPYSLSNPVSPPTQNEPQTEPQPDRVVSINGDQVDMYLDGKRVIATSGERLAGGARIKSVRLDGVEVTKGGKSRFVPVSRGL
jgi:hypothetical protein